MTTHLTMSMKRALSAIACALVTAMNLSGAQAQVVTESPEVVYTGTDAQLLAAKASQLGTAVAIYEYMHNTVEFSAYHGSRSGSVNTFLGQRGSDVDIASALIAMLRSQNIPARYAVGTVRIPAAQVTNWLGIPNLDVAIQVLKDQGIQGVVLATDRSTVDMEHTWAEAFVPFDQYRGINTVTPAIDCSQSANFSRCTWVGLDASFKQKTYNGLNLDPYNAVSFDYTAYYNAIKNNDATRRDKNPLTILEDQIGTWLRANYPGKTLEDVEDAGKIIEIREGLLPASLPYQVISSSIRRYDTVDAHDAVVPATEPKKWAKFLTATPYFNGAPSPFGGATVRLTDLATKRFTYTFTSLSGTSTQAFRLGGTQLGGSITVSAGTFTINGVLIQLGAPLSLVVTMEGAPGATSGDTDRTITATYSGIIGGYYLMATGGESSNWSQVHRAADQLLASNDQYKIVINPSEAGCFSDGTNCTPYVDANGNGWDATDTKLLETKPALDALTGGLLYVGATQYYSKLREQIERADRLMKTKTPVIGFLGVVSSVYEAEYIDGTAFSILPGGLLIDMKGITIGGAYRTNEAAVNFSNRQFEFAAHFASSLEHEIWQELTGYDAVSTVRGIQMALAGGTATLLNPKKNSTSDTLPGLYSSFGFTSSAPSGFTYAPLTVFSTSPANWQHTVNGSQFDTFLGTVTTGTGSLQGKVATYMYSTNSGLYGWSKCVANQVAQINSLPNGLYSGSTCSGVSYTTKTKDQILSIIGSDWSGNIIPNILGQSLFDYFDRNKAFNPVNQIYRAYPSATLHDAVTIASIRNDLYLRDITQSWIEYLIPSTLVTGATYRFSVDIRKAYTTANGNLASISMEILNKSLSAGGGYVGLDSPPLAATSPLPTSAFTQGN